MTHPLPHRSFPAPHLYPEAQPWLMTREAYKRQRARRRLMWRAALAAAGFSLLATLAVVVI